MTPCPRMLVLASGLLALMAPTAQASTITDFLDRIGGCRKPMTDSFSYEISPYTPKPYGKALADWTDDDVSDFRAYFVACQTQRSDWSSIGEYNRNRAISQIDTAMAELRPKIGEARAAAEQQRLHVVDQAEKRQREDAQQHAEAVARTERAEAERQAVEEQHRRMVAMKPRAQELVQQIVRFLESEGRTLSPEQRLAQLNQFLNRLQALISEAEGTPLVEKLQGLYSGLRTESEKLTLLVGRQPAAPGQTVTSAGTYTDFERLTQVGVLALTNPLRSTAFVSSLQRGIDLNVGVLRITSDSRGYLLQLWDMQATPADPAQGFFCRVPASDTGSLAVLETMTPPYAMVHATASGTEEAHVSAEPLHFRVVFASCRITPMDGGPRAPARAGAEANTADPGSQARPGSSTIVAPSPPDLRCEIRPHRREEEQVMAQRLRRAWVIPEALRSDPTLMLTFGVTLNFDAELTKPPSLTTSRSRHATPKQLQAAVEAASQAIRETAPFPELGQYAGGTMQIDMTPCD